MNRVAAAAFSLLGSLWFLGMVGPQILDDPQLPGELLLVFLFVVLVFVTYQTLRAIP